MIGPTEILIIVLVVLILFGASAIPKFARSLGLAKKEFTSALKETETETEKEETNSTDSSDEKKA
jgi:sec-independent protein translocase protein TatA